MDVLITNFSSGKSSAYFPPCCPVRNPQGQWRWSPTRQDWNWGIGLLVVTLLNGQIIGIASALGSDKGTYQREIALLYPKRNFAFLAMITR